jgi:hypothetical protein
MKDKAMLTVASVLSAVFFMFHVTDDIVRGIDSGRADNLTAIPIFFVWLYGALVLRERRSGHVIMLLASILGLGVPVIHMRGKGIGDYGRFADSDGHFFFVFTLLALGVTALFALVLSARGLWSLKAGRSGSRDV